MKEIHLQKDRGIVLVDDEDFEKLNQFKWCIDHDGYAIRHFKGKRVFMHREILSPSVNTMIDHIDRNKLNNQKSNLRFANHKTNAENQGIAKNNSSGYRGVSWHKHHKKWMAMVQSKGKNYHAGYYDTAKEAGLAAENMRRQLGFFTNELYDKKSITKYAVDRTRKSKNNSSGYRNVYCFKKNK